MIVRILVRASRLAICLGAAFAVSDTLAADLAVKETASVAASPDKVWAVLGKFSGMPGWHPAVAATDIVKGADNQRGAVRSITTKDGAQIVEELLAYNASKHSMTYRINASPLPVTDYVSTLAVTPSGKGSKITWKSQFKRDPSAKDVDDAKAKDIIAGIYKSGFDGLRAALGETAR
jgi:mxaD protein